GDAAALPELGAGVVAEPDSGLAPRVQGQAAAVEADGGGSPADAPGRPGPGPATPGERRAEPGQSSRRRDLALAAASGTGGGVWFGGGVRLNHPTRLARNTHLGEEVAQGLVEEPTARLRTGHGGVGGDGHGDEPTGEGEHHQAGT